MKLHHTINIWCLRLIYQKTHPKYTWVKLITNS